MLSLVLRQYCVHTMMFCVNTLTVLWQRSERAAGATRGLGRSWCAEQQHIRAWYYMSPVTLHHTVHSRRHAFELGACSTAEGCNSPLWHCRTTRQAQCVLHSTLAGPHVAHANGHECMTPITQHSKRVVCLMLSQSPHSTGLHHPVTDTARRGAWPRTLRSY
jgi:hypothetical protein